MLRIEALTVGDLIMNIRYGLFARVCADQKNVERVCQPSPFKILVRLEKTIGKEGLHTWPIEDVRLVKKTRY